MKIASSRGIGLAATTVLTLGVLTGCAAASEQASAPVELPHVAQARVDVQGWTLADAAQVSSVAAQVGDTASGSIAMTVDSASETTAVALSQTAAVSPSTSYELSAMVRVVSST